MNSPSFQFYATDWLGSQRVTMLTLEEEGAYIRLIAYCWQHGSIPSDPDAAARLIGKGGSRVVAETVLKMFQPAKEKGRMIHDRLEQERDKQKAWRKKSSIGGCKSAQNRSKGGSMVVQPPLQPNGNIPSPSPSPSPIRVHSTDRPSESEVVEVAKMIGLAEWKARDWFQEMESCGWIDYKHRPILDYRASLSRVRSKWEADGRPSGPPANRSATNGEALTRPMDIKAVIQAKELKAAEIRNKHCSETAMDQIWSSPEHKSEFLSIKREIKALNNKLSNLA